MILKLHLNEQENFYNEEDPLYSQVKYIGYQPMTHTISYIKISDKCFKAFLCVHTVLYVLKDGFMYKERNVNSVKIKKLYQDLEMAIPNHFKGAEYSTWITLKNVDSDDEDDEENEKSCLTSCVIH
jgi:hypothetical protein